MYAQVIAQSNWAGGKAWKTNARPDGGSKLVFDFPYGANPWDEGWQTVEPRQYVNASVTQLFYLANMYHDLLYLYGFDEASGNFQQYNFENGGSEGDGVIVDAQDSSGFNNANFMTVSSSFSTSFFAEQYLHGRGLAPRWSKWTLPDVRLEHCQAIPRRRPRLWYPHSRALSWSIDSSYGWSEELGVLE